MAQKMDWNVYCLCCGERMIRKRKTRIINDTLYFIFECKPCKRKENLIGR